MSKSWRAAVIVLVVALGAVLSGCSRDAEVTAALSELDTFTATLVQKVKTAPNPAAGVAAGQAYLDANKAALQQKLAAVKDVKNFQVSEETKKKLESTFIKNASAVAGLELDYVTQAAMDPTFRTKIEKLINDYKNAVTQ